LFYPHGVPGGAQVNESLLSTHMGFLAERKSLTPIYTELRKKPQRGDVPEHRAQALCFPYEIFLRPVRPTYIFIAHSWLTLIQVEAINFIILLSKAWRVKR
jgi:hypothetical protein